MFLFWMLLSEEFTFILILSGLVSSLFVSFISHDLLFGRAIDKSDIVRVHRFIRYLPWLLWQIIISNFDIAYRALHPKMPIDPCIVRFNSELKSELGIAILANSITLTPGTVTVMANEKGDFVVHSIVKGDKALPGIDIQAKVKKIEGVMDV